MNLPDVSVIKLLPPNLAHDKNIRMACEAFDEELRRIIADIPGIAIIPNLVRKEITDNLLLDLLAWQFHVDFYDTGFSLEKKQQIILKSMDWHTRKGTPSVVEEIVSTVFSKAIVQEWFEYGGLPHRYRVGTEEDFPDEQDMKNFYRAISSVQNTRSWLDKLTSFIYFEEEFNISETNITRTKIPLADQMAYIFRNGQYRRNGQISRSDTGVKDVISVSVVNPQSERLLGIATRNGLFRRNGAIMRDGFADDLHTEITKHKARSVIIDNVDLSESVPVTLSNNVSEVAGQELIRNGQYRRNGERLRRSNSLQESIVFKSSVLTKEILQGRALRNGMYLRNGEIQRGLLNTSMTEKPLVKVNTVLSDLMISDDLISDLTFRKHIEETFKNGVLRNGECYRNGKLARGFVAENNTAAMKLSAFTEAAGPEESFAIGYKKHRYRNGQYRRNGEIRRDANVLIPLEG
jgi:phage tail P2-like protein